ncbi:MAG: hypothetical protein IJ745_04690 [Bacteroidales bacterium]|nr:hypothetical protein [Bacteroidales bacterium]
MTFTIFRAKVRYFFQFYKDSQKKRNDKKKLMLTVEENMENAEQQCVVLDVFSNHPSFCGRVGDALLRPFPAFLPSVGFLLSLRFQPFSFS